MASRTRAASVYASSSPTSPCLAHGKRAFGLGTTHKKRALSSPSLPSAVSTESGSPGIAVAAPVRPVNQTLPRLLSWWLIAPSLLWLRPTPYAATPGRSAATHRALRCALDRAPPARCDALCAAPCRYILGLCVIPVRHRHPPVRRPDPSHSVACRRESPIPARDPKPRILPNLTPA